MALAAAAGSMASMRTRQRRNLVAGVVVLSTVLTAGCGMAFGSRGEADRAEKALQEAPAVPGGGAAAGAAPAPPSVPVSPNSTVDPLAPPTVPPIPAPVEEQDVPEDPPVNPFGSMSGAQIDFCTEVASTIGYAVGTFGEAGLPKREIFLALVGHVQSRIKRVTGLDQRPATQEIRSRIDDAVKSLEAADTDQELAIAIPVASNIITAYLVNSNADCEYEASGFQRSRSFQQLTPEMVSQILVNT